MQQQHMQVANQQLTFPSAGKDLTRPQRHSPVMQGEGQEPTLRIQPIVLVPSDVSGGEELWPA